MDPERWRELDRAVQSALDEAPELRIHHLRVACGDDRELFEEAVRLLEADEHAGDFLALPLELRAVKAAAGQPAAPRPERPKPGDRLGPYRLLRCIGQGGMGSVFLAERADGTFEQRVAIKIVREDLASSTVGARFLAERQILASLDHPSIARLLDGGTTDRGAPYLVMEHVEGSPIDEHCDRQHLGVRSRLELFLRVCSAVRTAHQNLVVHRDLKPTNILVTDDGVPKLLDFGVAKLLEPAAFSVPVETTVTGQRPLTLSYASPEQLTGKLVTTVSDIYSLGVLLYRLLTGELPRRFRGFLPVDVMEMLREPAAPSTVVGDEAAAARGVSVAQLTRQLRGDLDRIVLKALRSEPKQRYSSVAELEDDLSRHLTGRPIRARPASRLYVARKFLRRNWIAATLAVALLVLLLASHVLALEQRDRLAIARDQAESSRVQAEKEQEKAQQVADLMVGLFDDLSPERARGHEVTLREVLDRRAASVAAEFADRPELLATLKAKMGDIYRKLGAYPEARKLLEESLSLRESVLPPDDPVIAKTLSDLAAVYALQGERPEAARLLERAVPILRAKVPPDDPAFVPALGRLAILRSRLGDVDGSEALSREVLHIQTQKYGPVSAPVAHVLHNYAVNMARNGQSEKAGELFRRALAIQEKLLPADDPNLLRGHANLGLHDYRRGAYAEARRHLARALAGEEKVFGPDHEEVGVTAYDLGNVLRVTGDLDGAEALYRQAARIYRAALPPVHSQVAMLEYGFGRLAEARGRLHEAERRYRKALDIHRHLPTDATYLAMIDLARLADLYLSEGRLDEAEARLADAEWIAAESASTPVIDGYRARVLAVRARLHERRHQRVEAMAAWRRVVGLTRDGESEVWLRDVRSEALGRLAVMDGSGT